MTWEWSAGLQAQLDQLSPQQQRAILLVVMAESRGEPITRLLRTPYSCEWCGQVIGHSADGKAARKAALVEHGKVCERGPGSLKDKARPWRFATSLVTFYTRWKIAGSLFESCLNQARREVRDSALSQAAWILQMGAPEAAKELRRQVTGLDASNKDRRLASEAILRRVNLQGDGGGDGAADDSFDGLDDDALRAEEERLGRILAEARKDSAAAGATEAAGPDQ